MCVHALPKVAAQRAAAGSGTRDLLISGPGPAS